MSTPAPEPLDAMRRHADHLDMNGVCADPPTPAAGGLHCEAYRLAEALASGRADGWDEGVATALDHAVLNDDGITLRLEHHDERPWRNPYRPETPSETTP